MRTSSAPKKRGKGKPRINAKPMAETLLGMGSREICELAQLIIEDRWVTSLEELRNVDREMHGLVCAMGLSGSLRFKELYVKRDEAEKAVGAEEEMFRVICTGCFRLGTASPVVGRHRATMQQLTGGAKNKINGPALRLFWKCWEAMEKAGLIRYNCTRTAASLDLKSGIPEGEMRSALVYAISEQMKIDPAWETKFGSLR
jgi:hypothetical protein